MYRKCKSAQGYYIHQGILYFEDTPQCSIRDAVFTDLIEDKEVKVIRLLDLFTGWTQNLWVDFGVSVSDTINFEMTLRKEIRSGRAYWYAYRKVHGTLHKRSIGTSEKMTEARLIEVARALPSR